MTEFYLRKVQVFFDASTESDFCWIVKTAKGKALGAFPDRQLAEAFILTAELIDSAQGEHLHAQINPEEN